MPPNLNLNTGALRSLQQENLFLKEENHTLREELVRLRQTVSALNSLQQSLDSVTPQTNVFSLLKQVLASALRSVDSEDGSLQLLDEETGELVFVEVQGSTRSRLLGYRLPLKEGIAGWVAQNREAKLVSDVNQEPRFSPLVDRMIGFRTASLLCVPLVDGERTLGVIEAVNKRGGEAFSNQDLDILLLVARLAALALQRAEGRG